MKYSIFILILLTACKKDPDRSTETRTTTKHCQYLRSESYDVNTGELATWSISYYSGNRLDSSVYFLPQRAQVSRYVYLGTNTRKGMTFLANGQTDSSYSIQTLDANNYVLETKSYSKDGTLIHWSKTEYKCQ